MPDSQCYACNLEWFSSLPGDVQEAVEWASEMSFHQNLAKVPSARTFAMAEMRKAGVEFHSLTDDQLAEWKDTVGYQRSEWDSFKTELAGADAWRPHPFTDALPRTGPPERESCAVTRRGCDGNLEENKS